MTNLTRTYRVLKDSRKWAGHSPEFAALSASNALAVLDQDPAW